MFKSFGIAALNPPFEIFQTPSLQKSRTSHLQNVLQSQSYLIQLFSNQFRKKSRHVNRTKIELLRGGIQSLYCLTEPVEASKVRKTVS